MNVLIGIIKNLGIPTSERLCNEATTVVSVRPSFVSNFLVEVYFLLTIDPELFTQIKTGNHLDFRGLNLVNTSKMASYCNYRIDQS